MYKLEERYKNEEVAIRRLFGIWEMKVQFPAVRYNLWDVGQVIWSPTAQVHQWDTAVASALKEHKECKYSTTRHWDITETKQENTST